VKIFQPLITAIEGLVKDQVSSVKIKRMEEQRPNASEIKVCLLSRLIEGDTRSTHFSQAIFLVGGFGSSSYLKEALQQANPGIKVIQPHDAWVESASSIPTK
jgi:hypothetical protein